jgi:hypothetical protein
VWRAHSPGYAYFTNCKEKRYGHGNFSTTDSLIICSSSIYFVWNCETKKWTNKLGMSCANKTTQGEHYFTDPVTSDPWTQERYSSTAEGTAQFANLVAIGDSASLDGRAFIGMGNEDVLCVPVP